MQKKLFKVVLGGVLAALAVGINLFFQYFVPNDGTFGLPIYSIPLVASSLYLGPLYGLIVGFVADLGIGFLGPYGYKPLFVLSTLSWAFFPGLIARKNYNFFKMAIAIIVAYLMASFGNTLAMYVHYDKNTAIGSLLIRLPILIGSTPPLIYIDHIIYDRILAYKEVDSASKEHPIKI